MMLMNEAREKTGLTRKAIAYYEEKGFIAPAREQNNYRVYSEADVAVLQKISLYRKLGCSIEEIKDILQGSGPSALATMIRDREIKSQAEQARVDNLKLLLQEADPEEVEKRLDWIDQQETIYAKLMRAFPGYFGQLLFLSYMPFLEAPLEHSRAKYYQEYVDFLDQMPDFELDEEEKLAIEDASKDISIANMAQVNQQKMQAVEHADVWLEENKEMLAMYKAFKESDSYLNHPIYRLQQRMKKHMEDSGYYDKAIPLMRQFSPAYDAYYKQLLDANQKFLEKNA